MSEAENKISGLPSVTAPTANSVLLIVVWPFGSSSSKQITLTDFFGNVAADIFTGHDLTVEGNTSLLTTSVSEMSANSITVSDLTVSSNGVVITESFTPANSAIITDVGRISWDANYLYVTTATGVIKRVALQDF